MMIYLIHTNPPALAPSPVGGSPLTRNAAEGQTLIAPAGMAYVPDLPQPDYDPATHRLERADPTLDGYGWQVVDLTEAEIEARNPPPSLRDRLRAIVGDFPPNLRAQFPFERVAYWLGEGDAETAKEVIAGIDLSGRPQDIKDARDALLTEFDA